MKIFLTGGNGFIGRNIIEQLGRVYEIIAPTHAELELTDTDAVYRFLELHPVDVLIHAANIGGNRKQKNLSGVADINLKIFFNLVRARQFFGRMITLGSGAEYDKKHAIANVKETDFGQRVPGDEYGFYKYVCAQYAHQVDYITHLRLFAVFGKYEDYETRFISSSICRALLGLPIVIHQNVVFDYLFIDDFVKVLDALVRKKPINGSMNIGRGVGVDLKTISEIVLRKMGLNVPIEVQSEGYGNEYTCKVSRLNEEIGETVFEPIEVSISKMISYYRFVFCDLNPNFT